MCLLSVQMSPHISPEPYTMPSLQSILGTCYTLLHVSQSLTYMLELLHYPCVAADVLPGRGLLGGARHRLHLRPRHQAQVRGLQGGPPIDIYISTISTYLHYPGGVSRGVPDQAAGEAGLQEDLRGGGPQLQRSPRCWRAVYMQGSVWIEIKHRPIRYQISAVEVMSG